MQDYLERLEIEAWERDRKRKWWQAKERPDNLFDRAPLFFTFAIGLWIVAAIIPAIAMLVPSFACDIGASSMWCKP